MQLRKLVSALALTIATASAYADVVAVVSAKSGVGNLNTDQVGQIFLGKSATFPNGETAVPLDQADGPAKDEFYSKAVGKDSAQLKAYWSQLIFNGKGKPPKAVPDGNEVKKLVAANPNMIGYISKASVDGSVKVVWTP